MNRDAPANTGPMTNMIKYRQASGQCEIGVAENEWFYVSNGSAHGTFDMSVQSMRFVDSPEIVYVWDGVFHAVYTRDVLDEVVLYGEFMVDLDALVLNIEEHAKIALLERAIAHM